MPLHLIYAKSRNNIIGKDGKLPWDLPEDLAHFKKTTLGCPVIMGGNTWNSLPEAVRPLPNRRNIVVSRRLEQAPPGADLARSLLQASEMVPFGANVWVIGGASLFEQALEVAASVVETQIDIDCEGDTFAPILDGRWKESSRERHRSKTGLVYDIVRYVRKVPLHKEGGVPAVPEFPDRGPWRPGATRSGDRQRVFVESDDFKQDVRLYVDGNFGSLGDKMDYARGLAQVLNEARKLQPERGEPHS